MHMRMHALGSMCGDIADAVVTAATDSRQYLPLFPYLEAAELTQLSKWDRLVITHTQLNRADVDTAFRKFDQ